jgi:hypothetical protein
MIRIKGEYEIWKDGVMIDHFHNIITTPVYEYILKSLAGESLGDASVSYFALGTGTTPVTESDTTLGTEVFRKAFTSKSWNGKQFVAICQLSTSEANYSITEVGIFAGGTITPNSGTLLSHALRTIEKNSNITYNIIYRLNLEEV